MKSVNIPIRNQQVLNEKQFSKVVDTSFKTFTKPTAEQDIDTIEELFRLYEKLYFIIPIEGEINSHQYLLKKSSEITSFQQTTEDIQPLLDEISQLRTRLLQCNEDNLQLQNQLAKQV